MNVYGVIPAMVKLSQHIRYRRTNSIFLQPNLKKPRGVKIFNCGAERLFKIA